MILRIVSALLLCIMFILSGCNMSSSLSVLFPPFIPDAVASSDMCTRIPAKDIYTLKLGHQISNNAPEGFAANYFADQVHEKTDGAVEVLVFPGEQLGTPVVMFEGTSVGIIDIAMLPCNQLTKYNAYFTIGSIPFLFPSNEFYVDMLYKYGVAESEERTINEYNMVLLNTARNFYRGPYRVIVSKKPIRSLKDVKGLRIRVFENAIYMNSWKILGADPIFIPWNETYMALMQGAVEAATVSLAELPSTRFTDIMKYVTAIKEYNSEVIFLMNIDSFENLPKEYQDIIIECANASGDYMANVEIELLQADLKNMMADGVEFISIEREEFRRQLKEYYYELENEGYLPPGTVDRSFTED